MSALEKAGGDIEIKRETKAGKGQQLEEIYATSRGYPGDSNSLCRGA